MIGLLYKVTCFAKRSIIFHSKKKQIYTSYYDQDNCTEPFHSVRAPWLPVTPKAACSCCRIVVSEDEGTKFPLNKIGLGTYKWNNFELLRTGLLKVSNLDLWPTILTLHHVVGINNDTPATREAHKYNKKYVFNFHKHFVIKKTTFFTSLILCHYIF